MSRHAAPPRAASTLSPVHLLALVALATGLWVPGMLGDGDTWWHVLTGTWILDHRAVPRTDLYSFTMPDAPWTTHEWLSEVLMAGAFRMAGWSGVVALSAGAAALSALLLGRRLARDLPPLALFVVLTTALALAGTCLLARPHILALPVLTAWTIGLLDARDAERAPSPWLLVLMVAWANLHGGYAFGIALVAPFALEALLAAPKTARLRVVLAWSAFGLAAVGAALVTPFGVEGLLFPLKLLRMASLSEIAEWQPVGFATVTPLEVALLALVGFALYRPVRVPPVRLVLLVGLTHMALAHSRHQLLLAAVGALLLARPLAAAVGGGSREIAQAPRAAWRARLDARAALSAAIAIALLAARLAWPLVREDGPVAPIAAVAAVSEALRGEPVLNEYGFGGYLIWAGIRPFVDGRADMYGDAFLSRYGDATRAPGPALDRLVDRYRIAWTILTPGDAVAGALDRMPGWRRIYADRYAVVHVRDDVIEAQRPGLKPP